MTTDCPNCTPAATPPPGVTHVLAVLDASGSMAPIATDVRGGFNAYIDGLRADQQQTYSATLTVFNCSLGYGDARQIRCTNLCTAAPLEQVPALDDTNYAPSGGTPLLDAIGKTITEFEAAATLGEHDRVLLVVQTDGQENASREFTSAAVHALITEREKGGRWSALFLGANRETIAQAASYGFQSASTVVVGGSAAANRATYDLLVGSTRSYAQGASGAQAARHIAENAPGDGA